MNVCLMSPEVSMFRAISSKIGLTKLELIAPTAKAIGILTLFSEIFLSLKIKVVLPSLTTVSRSFFYFL